LFGPTCDIAVQVSQFASVLESRGVVKGDRVLIYMPMIPEAIVAMLACARIGAVHSLVFGGFASKELATRINHAEVLDACFLGHAGLLSRSDIPGYTVYFTKNTEMRKISRSFFDKIFHTLSNVIIVIFF